MLKAHVLAHFGGSQVAVARALGVSKSAVSQWPKIVPLKSALRLQSLTKGVLRVDMKVYELPEFSSRSPSMRMGAAS
jgi:DNA-binding transcriptional regulator YdaS (Cro superfamily)